MSELFIRAACPADTPTIVRFNVALAEESEGLRLDPETVEAGVRRMFSDPALGRYLVAVSPREETVGQVMITTEWSDWRNCMIWWLQSVYTAPEHRGRGVFRLLCEHVLSEATRHRVPAAPLRGAQQLTSDCGLSGFGLPPLGL